MLCDRMKIKRLPGGAIGQKVLIKIAIYIQISTLKYDISSLELVFMEDCVMKQVNCPICGSKCVRYGKLKSGNQRWLCKSCKNVFTPKIDNDTKQLQLFLNWLFSKEVQSNMSDEEFAMLEIEAAE